MIESVHETWADKCWYIKGSVYEQIHVLYFYEIRQAKTMMWMKWIDVRNILIIWFHCDEYLTIPLAVVKCLVSIKYSHLAGFSGLHIQLSNLENHILDFY